MRGPEEWPSRRRNPADRIRLTGPAADFRFVLRELRTSLGATFICRAFHCGGPSSQWKPRPSRLGRVGGAKQHGSEGEGHRFSVEANFEAAIRSFDPIIVLSIPSQRGDALVVGKPMVGAEVVEDGLSVRGKLRA